VAIARSRARRRGRRRATRLRRHHYADLASQDGATIYDRANELLDQLPRTMRGLGRWIETLWPPR
jgi:hypothetical protein